jgi:methionyl-tRNA formyltransferase
MEKIKIAFFGTHNFAQNILENLLDKPNFDIKFIITAPDKPVGRKQELQKSPVKILAEKHNLAIFFPEKLKNFKFPEEIDLAITAQYGLIIPKHLLEKPKFGIINIHTSLLPKYRGASPIQSALLNNEKETGITIMKMDVGLDTGNILRQKEIEIKPDDTYLDLDNKLAELANSFLEKTILEYVNGEIKEISQDESKMTLCKQLDRNDGKVDLLTESATEIYNKYRAYHPWPGIWTVWKNKRIKLLKIKASAKKLESGNFKIIEDRLFLGTADNALEIFELQIEGKKSMDAHTFINGYKNLF